MKLIVQGIYHNVEEEFELELKTNLNYKIQINNHIINENVFILSNEFKHDIMSYLNGKEIVFIEKENMLVGLNFKLFFEIEKVKVKVNKFDSYNLTKVKNELLNISL